MSAVLPEFRVHNRSRMFPASSSLVDEDPRGFIWIFEPPSTRAKYVMGCDPSRGVTGWSRFNRTQDDALVDNGAIEIIKKGRNGEPDVQVAEYAGPIDAYDIAGVANLMGRLYAGSNEDNQALSIVEIWPGPGIATIRELVDRFGYTNQWVWKYGDSMIPKRTSKLGWESHKQSVAALWIKGTRHISTGKIKLLSPYLVEELANCEEDLLRQTAKAVHGFHDDRARALLMAIWAAHDWDMEVETDTTPAQLGSHALNWQSSDMSVDRMAQAWEDRFSEISDMVAEDY